jgi:hypothetical protein
MHIEQRHRYEHMRVVGAAHLTALRHRSARLFVNALFPCIVPAATLPESKWRGTLPVFLDFKTLNVQVNLMCYPLASTLFSSLAWHKVPF